MDHRLLFGRISGLWQVMLSENKSYARNAWALCLNYKAMQLSFSTTRETAKPAVTWKNEGQQECFSGLTWPHWVPSLTSASTHASITATLHSTRWKQRLLINIDCGHNPAALSHAEDVISQRHCCFNWTGSLMCARLCDRNYLFISEV